METRESVIRRKIAAFNAAYDLAEVAQPILREYFAGLIGKKIITVDGVLTKRVNDGLNALKLGDTLSKIPGYLQHYASSRSYNLAFTIRTCVNQNGIAYYDQETIPIGDYSRDRQTLKKLCSPIDYAACARADYDTLMHHAEKIDELQKAIDTLKTHPYRCIMLC